MVDREYGTVTTVVTTAGLFFFPLPICFLKIVVNFLAITASTVRVGCSVVRLLLVGHGQRH
jgi:hypothetical protein